MLPGRRNSSPIGGAEYPEIDVASAKIGILSDKAKTVVEAEQREIAFYEKYRTYYSYGVFVVKKV